MTCLIAFGRYPISYVKKPSLLQYGTFGWNIAPTYFRIFLQINVALEIRCFSPKWFKSMTSGLFKRGFEILVQPFCYNFWDKNNREEEGKNTTSV